MSVIDGLIRSKFQNIVSSAITVLNLRGLSTFVIKMINMDGPYAKRTFTMKRMKIN